MARAKKVNLVGPVVVVLLVVGGCGVLIDKIFGTGEPARASGPATVPNLVNGTLVDAENKAEALGLDLSISGIDGIGYCGDKTDCVIYRMSPKPGTVVQAGAKIAVKYATGDELAFYRKHKTMPKLVGWSEAKADRLFEPVRDVVDSASYKESSRVPVGKNQVIAQSPKPGRPLRIGQQIRLVIGYNYGSSSGTGDLPDGNVNLPNGRRGESRFCSGKWWC
jgi:beta-lactam-binding protein with PASTA domain